MDRCRGAGTFPPQLLGWVIVYPRGQSITPETPAWRESRRQVEARGDRGPHGRRGTVLSSGPGIRQA
jgi:hypothetical protein